MLISESKCVHGKDFRNFFLDKYQDGGTGRKVEDISSENTISFFLMLYFTNILLDIFNWPFPLPHPLHPPPPHPLN